MLARTRSVEDGGRPSLLRLKQVAELLQVSEWKVRMMVAAGELSFTRVGRLLRIPEAEVRRFVQRSTETNARFRALD